MPITHLASTSCYHLDQVNVDVEIEVAGNVPHPCLHAKLGAVEVPQGCAMLDRITRWHSLEVTRRKVFAQHLTSLRCRYAGIHVEAATDYLTT